MNIPGSENATWVLIYPDGRYCSNEEKHWSEVSAARVYDGRRGQETLMFSREPASEMSAQVRGKWHTLKAPEASYFFQFYRSRKQLFGDVSEIIYHAIGYVGPFGRITLEISPTGDTVLRFDPILV